MSKMTMRLRDALPTIEDAISDGSTIKITEVAPDAPRFTEITDKQSVTFERFGGKAFVKELEIRAPIEQKRCFVGRKLALIQPDAIVRIEITPKPEPAEV